MDQAPEEEYRRDWIAARDRKYRRLARFYVEIGAGLSVLAVLAGVAGIATGDYGFAAIGVAFAVVGAGFLDLGLKEGG